MALYEHLLAPHQHVGEGSTWYYTMTLTDKTGAAIPSAGLNTVTLTLLDLTVSPPAVVNGCHAANIKNTGRGLITAQGVLSLTSAAGDTAILHAANAHEIRLARVEWTKTTGGDSLWREITFVVAAKIPAPLP